MDGGRHSHTQLKRIAGWRPQAVTKSRNGEIFLVVTLHKYNL
jgi:hypothetical protein